MKTKNPEISAKAAEGVIAGKSLEQSSQLVKTRGPSHLEAEKASKRILAVLEKGLYSQARDQTREALDRFPTHTGLRKLWSRFDNRGKSWIEPGGADPGRQEEFEWLRHPPAWARGKWVALVGSKVVAMDESLQAVSASVRSQKLSRRPLVHRIA